MLDSKDSSSHFDVIVIGGGPAGFFSAISASEKNNLRCAIFESTKKTLSKVLVSGGGRCNVTHNQFDPKELVTFYPRGHKELLGLFTKFGPRETVEWFEARGVPLTTESDNRMFPTSNSSHSIERALKRAAEDVGITIFLETKIVSIEKNLDIFILHTSSGRCFTAQKVVLATGSSQQGYAIAQSLGHTIQSPVPSLFTFEIDDVRLKDLSGVSFPRANVQLLLGKNLQQKGPLLITHWGVSGPAIIKLSAWGARLLHEAQYNATLKINFLPEENFNSCYQKLIERRTISPKKSPFNDSLFDMPKSYWERILDVSDVPEVWGGCSNEIFHKISKELTEAEFRVSGKGKFKEEFVTCGGVTLSEVDFRTMESKVCTGLYFSGEVLDVDGVTGGFNFQAAWSTGWVLGQSIKV